MKRILLEKYYYLKRSWKAHKLNQSLFFEQRGRNAYQRIQLYNWWPDDAHSQWLFDFITENDILKDSRKTVSLCSVFGEKEILDFVDTDIRIFFSGENLHNPRHAQYADYMLSGKRPFDLALGFDCFEHEKYLRFPLWLTYMFAPNATEEDIYKRCKELRFPKIDNKTKYASLIARYDWNGIRGEIVESLNTLEKVDCPSALLHNDDTLQNQFKDDKTAYLMQYKFNICPENTNAYGYVTEKLFEAISAGCIPIYWGNYNSPESKILNPNAIIFWDKENYGEKALEQIRDLYLHPDRMREFMGQPRLLPGAEEEIFLMINDLKSRLMAILQ